MPNKFDPSLSISLCIATHERAVFLASTLEAISLQTRLPYEIIISDSSKSADSEQVVNEFQKSNPHLCIKYLKSKSKALPWHRWNGYQHSQGEVVLFLDDDITLMPTALDMLRKTYEDLSFQHGMDQVSGVGLYIYWGNGDPAERRPDSYFERWLGIANAPSASITPGGLGIAPKSMPRDTCVEVGRLSGGGMSFRREVLKKIGCLNNLIELYDNRVGRSEDRVLSHYARMHGRLFMTTYLLAIHPDNDGVAFHSATSYDGWYQGVTETWGRANTMRWISTDLKAYRLDWLRVATFELLSSIFLGIFRQPFSAQSWHRLAGAIYGIGLTIIHWNQIPSDAKTV